MKAIPSSGQDKTRDYLNHKKTLQKPNQNTEPRTPVSDPQEKTQTQHLKRRTAMSSKHGKKNGRPGGREKRERERENRVKLWNQNESITTKIEKQHETLAETR